MKVEILLNDDIGRMDIRAQQIHPTQFAVLDSTACTLLVTHLNFKKSCSKPGSSFQVFPVVWLCVKTLMPLSTPKKSCRMFQSHHFRTLVPSTGTDSSASRLHWLRAPLTLGFSSCVRSSTSSFIASGCTVSPCFVEL